MLIDKYIKGKKKGGGRVEDRFKSRFSYFAPFMSLVYTYKRKAFMSLSLLFIYVGRAEPVSTLIFLRILINPTERLTIFFKACPATCFKGLK